MPFLDVKTDFAFKKVFGSEESKDILLSFLNALLDFGQETIVDLTLVDPYQIPLIVGMKDTYVDVKAQLSNSTQVIIEMQVLNVPAFEKRVLYNAAKAYSTQLNRGDDYRLLNPVMALTITDFIMFAEWDSIISYFKLLEKQRFISYSDDIELIFVELPKFHKTAAELTSITDKWIYFLKHVGQLETIPQILANDQAIQHAFQVANLASLSAQELEIQWKKIDFIMIQKALQKEAEQARQQLEQARQRAEQESQRAEQAHQRAEQESQRAEQAQEQVKQLKQVLTTTEQILQQTDKATTLRIAQQMLKTNANIDFIMRVTGLNTDEIKQLQNSEPS